MTTSRVIFCTSCGSVLLGKRYRCGSCGRLLSTGVLSVMGLDWKHIPIEDDIEDKTDEIKSIIVPKDKIIDLNEVKKEASPYANWKPAKKIWRDKTSD